MRPSPGQRTDNRVQEVSVITQGLKAIAKELNVPILGALSLSRAVEQREDKRPVLAICENLDLLSKTQTS